MNCRCDFVGKITMVITKQKPKLEGKTVGIKKIVLKLD